MQHRRATAASMFQNGISRNTNCDIMVGFHKSSHSLKERFYWPGHLNDVHIWWLICKYCATRKTHSLALWAPLGSITVGYPTQVMAVDLVGPLPQSTNVDSCILVVSDYFTCWMEALQLPNQEASTIVEKLVDEVFLRSLSQNNYFATKYHSLSPS